MFEQSLDISLISPQPVEQVNKRNQLEKDTSLEEILDEFAKQEFSPKKSLRLQNEIKKARTIVIKPTQKIPSLLLAADSTISSSDQGKLIKQVQFPRRDSKGLTVPTIQFASTRASIEMIHNIPESETRTTNLLSSHLSGSESPAHRPPMSHRGSKLLGNDLKLDSAHNRHLSSPNVIDLIQSSPRAAGSVNPLLNMMPNAPNSYTGPRFNISIPEKNSSPLTSKKLIIPDLGGNQYTSTPQSGRSLTGSKPIQMKIDSPHQGPITGDYLARVLQRSGGNLGGSHPGSQGGSTPRSTTDSPRSADLGEKNETRFAKIGSFSVFRKIAEAELVKNT